MVTESKQQMKDVAQDAKDLAKEAQNTDLVDRLTRLGYITRGLIYGMIAILAIQLIFTGQGKLTGREGALQEIARHPLGGLVLVVIAMGLVGLVLWGLIRAIANPYRKGTMSRLASLASAISYGVLLFPTVRLIMGAQERADESEKAREAARGLLAQPWGPWLVGLIAIALLVVAFIRIKLAFDGRFTEHFKSYQLSGSQLRWANRLGRFGSFAMGIVLGIVGILALLAAIKLDPNQVSSTDGALVFLSQQPYGPWLLGVVALGLLANAVYSVMGAMWFRIKGN